MKRHFSAALAAVGLLVLCGGCLGSCRTDDYSSLIWVAAIASYGGSSGYVTEGDAPDGAVPDGGAPDGGAPDGAAAESDAASPE